MAHRNSFGYYIRLIRQCVSEQLADNHMESAWVFS